MEEDNQKLLEACENGDEAVVQELIASKRVDVNAKDHRARTPLFLAMYYNHPAIVRLLLADPTTVLGAGDRTENTELMSACADNYIECVQLYLQDERCNIHIVNAAKNQEYKLEENKTALNVALQNGHDEIAKMLLAIPNIDVNACIKGTNYDLSPLDLAIKHGMKDVVSLLLENETTNLDVALYNDCEPMPDIEKLIHVECIKMVLENKRFDKNIINTHDPHVGSTALCFAMETGYLEIVKLLLMYPETSLENAGLDKGIKKGFTECVECFINNSRCTLEIINAYKPLHCAVQANDERMMQLILDFPDLDPNTQNCDGQTPLFFAMRSNSDNAVNILLKNDKVKLDAVDNEEMSPIFEAIERNASVALQRYVENERCTAEIVNSKNREGKTALYKANESRDLDMIKALLRHPGIDLNFEDYGKRCPIFLGMYWDDEELVKLSLRGKFDFNVVDPNEDNKTPLIFGCWRDSIKSVMIFMSDPRCTGAVLNQKDDYGKSALMYAVENGLLRMVSILKTHPDIDINAEYSEGFSPLMAAMTNQTDDTKDISLMVKLLLAHPDIKLDVLNNDGNCLHYACNRSFAGRNRSVEAFINDRRCTPEIVNNLCSEGKTPLMTAVKNHDSELVKIFTENPKVDCNIGNPLNYAVDNELTQIVQFLISNPTAKFDFPETFEDTGVIKACAAGNQTIIETLVNDKYERLTTDIMSLKNGLGRTALMTAVIYGNNGIVKEIVGKFGWQEELRNKDGQNALDLAKKFCPEMIN